MFPWPGESVWRYIDAASKRYGWFFLYAFFSQGMISEKIAEGERTGGKGGYQVNDAAKAGGFLHRAGTGKIPRRTNFSVDTPKAGKLL